MPVTPRYAVARGLGRLAAGGSRLARLGEGTTIGGRVTLAVDPSALRRAAAGRDLVLVTGTNGKTTTRSLLVAALRTRGRVVSNSGGANLPSGLTAALAGDPVAGVGVLEVDEPYLPQLLRTTTPRVVALLNLSRDQLDRYAEVRRLAGIWRAAFAGAGPPTVVANADDPLVAWAAAAADRPRWVAAGMRWWQDSVACPACGGVIVRGPAGWRCGCGLGRPRPDWSVTDDTLVDPDGGRHQLRLALPGDANRGNAAVAAAAAAEMGVPPAVAVPAMRELSAVEGRYLQTQVGGRLLRLLLAKNPAGWQEALSVLRPEADGVVVSVNARAADGRDPAWLWDVPFEVLRGRTVTATGERARDVAVRLRYAEVDHHRVDDPSLAVRRAAGGGPVEVLANYTAFQVLRRLLGA